MLAFDSKKSNSLTATHGAQFPIFRMVLSFLAIPGHWNLRPSASALSHHVPKLFGVASVTSEPATEANYGNWLSGPFRVLVYAAHIVIVGIY